MGSQGTKLSLCGQWRLWSDPVNAQADLSLSWAPEPFCWFCHGAAHLKDHNLHNAKVPFLMRRLHFFMLFTGKYTDNYIAYPGKFVQVLASVAIPNVNSADLCAYQCSQNVTCKSFDYCANKMCFLKTQHILQIPPVLVASSLTCSHYSSKYRMLKLWTVGSEQNIARDT